MSASHSNYDVAISGCGIAGATVAFLLAEMGHRVVLFEQAPVCGPVGAGILLQPSGQAVLSELGMLADVAERSAVIRELHAVTARGKQLVRLPYCEITPETIGLGVQRGVLFETLYHRCQASGVEIREAHHIVRREFEKDAISVVDGAGERHGPFDFLLGTDGSRSQLRESSGMGFRLHNYAHAALWYVGSNRTITDKLFQTVDGSSVLIGLLPTGAGQCSLFWGEREDGWDALRNQGLDAWKARLIDLCPVAEETVAEIDSFDQMTFATYRHATMSRWFDERTLFLGDAAHAMSPHLGQGVNLALIDALTFATSLRETSRFQDACQRYQQQRRRTIRFYSQLTRFLTPFFQSDSALRGWGRDQFLPWMPRIPWVRRQMLLTMAGLKQSW